MEMVISERFPCLSPFDIRKQKAYEVFLLIRRLNEYSVNKTMPKKTRRKAGDDWF